MKSISLPYDPQPRQALLHETKARQILYGGAAGGGKSHALRWEGYLRCLMNPGVQVYLFRRTQKNLLLNHVVKIEREIPASLATFSEKRYALEFVNGSALRFCYCEAEQDVENYQGAEIHELLIDEAALMTPYQIGYLRSRVRLGSFKPKQPEYLPRMVMGSNPGGLAHDWLKARFVTPAPPETIFPDPENGRSNIFIPARMTDNAHLEEGYDAQFLGMPEHLRRMLVDGDWDAVAGSYFDCWAPDRHVIPVCRVPETWTKFRAIDWGHATPFSVGWWAVADGVTPLVDKTGKEWVLPEGCLVRYREWYGGTLDQTGSATNKGLRLGPKEVAQGILQRQAPGEVIAYTVIDPSAARADTGPSVREELARAGVPNMAADNNRIAGWQQMYRRINDGMLVVMETCRDFVRTLPMLMPSEKDPEDVQKGGEDHVGDEARYACQSRPRVSREREGEPPVRSFAALLKQSKRNARTRERMSYGR